MLTAAQLWDLLSCIRRSPGQVSPAASAADPASRGRCLTGHSIFERVVVTFAPNRITTAPAFISPLTSGRCCLIVSKTRRIPLRLAASYKTRTRKAKTNGTLGREKTPNKVRTRQYLRVVGVFNARAKMQYGGLSFPHVYLYGSKAR